MTKRITPPAGKPLTASVEGEELVVRIGVGSLSLSVMEHEFWPDDHAIVDAGAFARMAADALPVSGKALDLFGSLSLWTADEAASVLTSAAVLPGSPEDASEKILAQTRDRLPPHLKDLDGIHRQDAKGRWTAEQFLDPEKIIEDDLVREIIADAIARATGLAEFRDEVLVRARQFALLLDQQYGVKKGGEKGNLTLSTIDGNEKVIVRINDLISFGPQLQQAKSLIDECMSEWAEGGRPELRAIVNRLFNVDKEGKINKADLLILKDVKIDDPRWKRAMEAINNSIRVEGTKTYVQFKRRVGISGKHETISLDIASAE